jgi:hypothetical protein
VEQIISKICDVTREHPNLALLAGHSLSMLAFSNRGMYAEDWPFALAFQRIKDRRVVTSDIPSLDDVISVCAGLVVVQPPSYSIREVRIVRK